jgi:acetyl-CoA carboxylase biotin carboxylase subunit
LVSTAKYENAGTVEFIVDKDDNFYFIEVNARIQVEHPVTEMVTGIDLIQTQIRVASGLPLPFDQKDIKLRGAAIECRINAEDPSKGFQPCPGLIKGLFVPGGMGVRFDSHVQAGYVVPPFYDSMIAKISVWGRDRKEAIQRGKAALRDTVVSGIKTNIPLHLQLLENEKFCKGDYTTRLIGEDFFYKDQGMGTEELRMAMIASAVQAFGKEYKGAKADEDNSRWRGIAREEALRK